MNVNYLIAHKSNGHSLAQLSQCFTHFQVQPHAYISKHISVSLNYVMRVGTFVSASSITHLTICDCLARIL